MIHQEFVELPHGLVHFRYAGHGPPVLLLHDSPRSSAMHTALIESLADEFTAIAIDTPGYGHSDPLPATPRPEIPDFARALAQTQAALGIERCAIYGFHTSSKILLQFALDNPQRVALAIIDGLNLPPGGPGDDFIARYMKPLPLSEDGSHLAAGWSRAREFMRFFPWFEATPRARLQHDFPTDDYLHGYALDLLTSGPHFSDAYSAAMRYLATPLVSQLRAPTVFMCRSNDPLYVFLDSLPKPLPEDCRIERLGPERDRWEARLRELLRGAQANTQPQSAVKPAPSRMSRRVYRAVPNGQWHTRQSGAGTGRPIVLLHESPGSSAGLANRITLLGESGRPVWAPDLPGHGESTALPLSAGAVPSLGDYADSLVAFLQTNNKDPVDLVACFTSAPLALLTAARAPQSIRSIICDGVPLATARARKLLAKLDCPRLVISRDGSHLLALWHQLRDRELHWPWYERNAMAMRRVTADLSAARMHGMTLDLARQIDHYGDLARASWQIDLATVLADVQQPVLLFKDPADPRLASSLKAKRRLPAAQLQKRADDPRDFAKAAMRFWRSLDQ